MLSAAVLQQEHSPSTEKQPSGMKFLQAWRKKKGNFINTGHSFHLKHMTVRRVVEIGKSVSRKTFE